MKKTIFNISAICLIILVILSCDKVEGPYIEGNPYTGVYDSDLPIRKILLEDFTGFGCTNCPQANEEIIKLLDRYGNHIVPVAVHAGWFATSFISGDPDFTTTIGEELGGNGDDNYGFFNITTQPIGVVNRISSNDDYKVKYEEWSKRIVDILSINKFADIDITIANTYNSDTKELEITINAEAINNVDAKLSLSVYIIENGVTGRQKDGSAVIEDYEHNHMLRAGVNGTWGNEVSTFSSFEAEDEIKESYSFILNDNWNENNCEIIAFIYNTDTKEVIQAEQSTVINK